MKTMIAAFLLTALPAKASRTTDYSKQCSAPALTAELRAAGFSVDSVVGAGDRCVVALADAEKKDPAAIIKAHVYASPRQLLENQRKTTAVELAALETKLDDGTITPAETRRLLKLMLTVLNISQKR